MDPLSVSGPTYIEQGVALVGSDINHVFRTWKRDLIAWFFLTLLTINPAIGGADIPFPVTWVWEVINSRP